MKRQRRTFSPEFKHDAAKLVLDQGYSHAEAARSLDIGETALRRWTDQLKAERSGSTPNTKALTPEQQRIQELEAQVNRLEREKSILKKATALLMSDEIKHIYESGQHTRQFDDDEQLRYAVDDIMIAFGKQMSSPA